MAGFRESLPDEARVNFERLMVSGAKALEFLGSQAVPALGNLVLLRRDSLLTDGRSTVPAEELSRLRHAALPTSAALFPPKLLDTALSKTRAASNDTLIHKALHQPWIPKRLAQEQGRASSSATPADRSGTSPLVPRQQQASRHNPSSSSLAGGKPSKGKRPFSQATGRSGSYGGKRKGSGKRST